MRSYRPLVKTTTVSEVASDLELLSMMRAERWFVLFASFLFVLGSMADSSRKHSRRKRKQNPLIRRDTNHSIGGEEDNFSAWTKWSRCTRRCRQRRRRRCVLPASCGTSLLMEERECAGGRCDPEFKTSEKKKKKTVVDEDEFRILHHVTSSPYSAWSEWSSCDPLACRTRRTKTCDQPEVCGHKKEIEESAVCFEEGSKCERMHRKKRKRKKANTGESVVLHHPLDDAMCGVSPLSSPSIPDIWNKLRIIGGREAKKGSWPWQLTMLNKFREPFCGATLLTPQWALTAAHCLRARLVVRSGEHSLMSAEGTEQESPVASRHPHPDFDPDTVSNDIALIRLKKPFEMDDHTRTACLPDGDGIGEKGIILGWGKRKSTAIYGTDHLHQAEVPVVPLSDCRTSYGTFPLNERMLCAGYRAGRVDSCAGDSGGPLLARRRTDGRWAVFGVTSFGDGCGQKGKFGIYTDVEKYVKWIRKTVARYS